MDLAPGVLDGEEVEVGMLSCLTCGGEAAGFDLEEAAVAALEDDAEGDGKEAGGNLGEGTEGSREVYEAVAYAPSSFMAADADVEVAHSPIELLGEVAGLGAPEAGAEAGPPLEGAEEGVGVV